MSVTHSPSTLAVHASDWINNYLKIVGGEADVQAVVSALRGPRSELDFDAFIPAPSDMDVDDYIDTEPRLKRVRDGHKIHFPGELERLAIDLGRGAPYAMTDVLAVDSLVLRAGVLKWHLRADPHLDRALDTHRLWRLFNIGVDEDIEQLMATHSDTVALYTFISNSFDVLPAIAALAKRFPRVAIEYIISETSQARVTAYLVRGEVVECRKVVILSAEEDNWNELIEVLEAGGWRSEADSWRELADACRAR